MKKILCTKKKKEPEVQNVWHYENDRCQAICRRQDHPLFATTVPDRFITKNPVHVNCAKCQQIMAKMGISIPAEMEVVA